MDIPCPACGKPISVAEPVGRRETCPRCNTDLHACVHCNHYEPGAYNDCREPQADRVVDKNASNFCDYFSVRTSGGKGAADPKTKAKSALDNLFKK